MRACLDFTLWLANIFRILLPAFSGTRYFSFFSLHSPAMKLKNSFIFIILNAFSASKVNSKHALKQNVKYLNIYILLQNSEVFSLWF